MLFTKDEIDNFTKHQLYKIIYSLELSSELKDYDAYDFKGMNRKTFTDIGSILDKARRAANLKAIKCLNDKYNKNIYNNKALHFTYYMMKERENIKDDLLKSNFIQYYSAIDTKIEVFTTDNMPKEKIFELSLHIISDNPEIPLITLLTLYTPAYDEADALTILEDAFMYLDRDVILNANKNLDYINYKNWKNKNV